MASGVTQDGRRGSWLAGDDRSAEPTAQALPASRPALRRRRPSWLEPRLVLGVLLVAGSVVAGIETVSASDRTVPVWQVRSDIAAGTTLTAADVRSVRVRLADGLERYVATTRSPAGLTASRDLGAGELLPAGALREPPAGSLVSIPVRPQHVPSSLRAGERIDVFATVKSADGSVRSDRVLAGVPVQGIDAPQRGLLSSTAEVAVIVRVPEDAATSVVKAVRGADIDIAVVSAAPASVAPASVAPASAAPAQLPSPAPSR